MTRPSLLLPSPHLLLPSPYLVEPSPLYLLNEYLPLILALEYLTGEEHNQELLQTRAGEELLTYRQLATGEFFRQFIDGNFLHWKATKTMKPLIELELGLWVTNLRMISRIQDLHPFFTRPHFGILFGALIAERQLMVLVSVCSNGQLVIKNYVGLVQSQNRRLQGCENPFNRDETPRTWEVINEAISIADRNDDFRREFYMPVVRARQQFVTYMKEKRFRGFLQGKLQRQGRKKQTKS